MQNYILYCMQVDSTGTFKIATKRYAMPGPDGTCLLMLFKYLLTVTNLI